MAHDDSMNVRLREVRSSESHSDAWLTDQMKQEQQSQKLELLYEKSVRDIDSLCEAEKLRQVQLQIMILEDTNDDLNGQLAQDDMRFDELQATQDELQSQLEASTKDFERVRGELRLKDREIETLKTELRSLQGISVDSSKLLTEKLALTRELATLKPELEHLRAQVSSDQSLLSEKLALERQVSSLQVELQTEKRAAQRASAKQEARQAEDSKLEVQVQNLQAELAKEKREKQKIENDAQKATADFESKKTVLESRLDAFRDKLRVAKEQLKDSQAELRNRTTAAARQSDARAESVFEARNPRKRSIAQVDFDSTIGTPGAQTTAKRGKRGSTLPGDKSEFSITPFLNRTASVAPESPPESENEAGKPETDNMNEVESHVEASSPSAKPKRRGPAKSQKPAALAPAKSAKANSRGRPAKAAISRKASMAPKLDQVAEEGEEVGAENVPQQPLKLTFPEETRPQVSRDSVEPTFIKKKRKILGGGLGKTIFDEDEGDAPKGGDRGAFGGIKSIGTLGKKGLGGVKLGPKLSGGAASGFGAFSPLKKDRKAGLLGA